MFPHAASRTDRLNVCRHQSVVDTLLMAAKYWSVDTDRRNRTGNVIQVLDTMMFHYTKY